MKTAFITGITGQDGALLAKSLLNKGYQVVGMVRRTSSYNEQRLLDIIDISYRGNLVMRYGDLTDSLNVMSIICDFLPDEVYNLGALTCNEASFEMPEYTANTNGIGCLRVLEAIKNVRKKKEIRFFQASTGEIFGDTRLNKSLFFHPKTPYAVAKLYAHWMTVHYREAHGLFACNGVLFNHESYFRSSSFLVKKIAKAVAKISLGRDEVLELGNLEAVRDWGYAPNYVEAMNLMLQMEAPRDLIIATGVSLTVRELVVKAFKVAGIELLFAGNGVEEKAYVSSVSSESKVSKEKLVLRIKDDLFRKNEAYYLEGDIEETTKYINWAPDTDLESMLKELIFTEIELEKYKYMITGEVY